MTTKSSRALHLAHYLHKHDQRIDTWQGATINGWYFIRFQEALSNGVIRFSFFKKDGSIREAVGTTNLLLIPDERKPKNTAVDHVPNYSTITFFDLQKSEWRSFNIASFIGFVSLWTLTPVTKPVLKREKEAKEKTMQIGILTLKKNNLFYKFKKKPSYGIVRRRNREKVQQIARSIP